MNPPDSPVLADAAAGWAAAYVHVPFCARVCPYCDFAVVAGRDELADRYLQAVLTEIDREAHFRSLDAVFVGGGTPTRVPARQLGWVLDRLRRRFGLRAGAEVSLEANPEDWTAARAEQLVAAGFNRVSFGAQSFDPVVLAYLGRRHQPAQIGPAVSAARAAGFRSVSLDLIFGAPPESDESWKASVHHALDLDPDHVSTYALTVERGTPLARQIGAGAPAPDAEVQADRYELAVAEMAAAGLVRYEVSNHARPGHAVLYNLTVWAQGEYLAFGNGAHRHREGERSWNVRKLDTYLERIEGGDSAVAGSERLPPGRQRQERVVLGLRRVAGVEIDRAVEALVASDWGRRLLAAGVIDRDRQRLRVTKPLLTDEVARAVLALPPGDC